MSTLAQDPSAEDSSTDSESAAETAAKTGGDKPNLTARIPKGGTTDPDEMLDLFLGWVADLGFELYEAQEEALLEIMAGRHVILNTPTGSGKSLVAMGMHFKALCEGKTCFYTSPIKALASEKFFGLCDDLGPENVGMQTGDASINPEAPIICCTAEVLMNRALRQGNEAGADYVVMDEFHYYGDPDRGVAWQVPLIVLPRSVFLLMSATLGNTAPIAERIEKRTGRKVSLVYSEDRPVPLDFEYRETPLHETLEELLDAGKAPIYIVNFTQRECAELAQSLTSVRLCNRDERQAIRQAIGDFRYDTPYGKDIRRYLGFGIGIHHAGLLPKYRLLVEQLAQLGHLKVICGTDTLGVGVNIPIRTVLFTKLSKYDGQKVTILKVRDFKQIAGRAGRRGFDDQGSVVSQAPEHVIETRKRIANPKKGKKARPKKAPPGFISWSKETFNKLIYHPPEMLRSRFRITHGMVVNLVQRDSEEDVAERDNFDSLRELIALCHEPDAKKKKLLSYAAMLVRSMHRSGILKMERDSKSDYLWAVVNEDLQWDFSLFQALALYMVEAIEVLDQSDPEYALDVVTLVEAILEDPRAVLYRQVDKAKGDLIGRLKAEGVPYEERMEKLEEVTYPKPSLEFINATFDVFRQQHPWVRGEDIHPKSIGREIYEGYHSFNGYVRNYGLQRSEGVLLRYLSQLYKTLSQTVPERGKTEGVYDIIGFFRTMLERTDSSLLDEWENMLHPELELDATKRELARRELRAYELLHDPRALPARLRAELHQLVRVLARQNYDGAVLSVWQLAEHEGERWPAERFEAAMGPFYADYEKLMFNHEARQAQNTRIVQTSPRTWDVTQVLVDPVGDNHWYVDAQVDLTDPRSFEGSLLRLRRIGT